MVVPIDSVSRDERRLYASRPVQVSIERVEGGCSAENVTLQIFAAGPNAQDALADFRSQLFEMYTHYAGLGEDDVVGDAERLRNLFQNNFSFR